MFIIGFVIAIISSLIIYAIHCQYGEKGKLLNKLPGPLLIPVFGNAFYFLGMKRENVLPMIDKFKSLYYPIYRIWYFGIRIIHNMSPEDLEALLTSSTAIKKSHLYHFLKSWLKDGLLLSHGEKWHERRKILTPAFHFNVLKKYLEILQEHGAKLVESLSTDKREVTVDLIPFLTYHTLSAICETAMGTSLHCMNPDEVEKYREAVYFMGEILIYRLFRPWFYLDIIFLNFTQLGRKQRKALKTLHTFSRKIINERKDYHKKTSGQFLKQLSTSKKVTKDDENGDIKGEKKRLAMLDLLIAASHEGLIDEAGIAEEVDTFIFEGHDTVAMALVFFIQSLAENIDVQEKARFEVNELWEKCDGKFDMTTFNKLPYLERCVRESLRLYPSVPIISRIIDEDLQTKNYLLPKNTIIDILIHEIHRDPKYWPDPLKFDPDRFLPEKILNRHPFCYLPFSAGPRNCIGQRFAMMELKIFTAYILRHFKLKPLMSLKNYTRMPDLVLRPKESINVKFVRLQK